MGLLVTLACLILPLLGLLHLYFRRRYSYWADRNVPHDRGSLPMGSLNGFGTKYHFSELLDRVYQQFKKVTPAAGMYTMVTPTLLICDLDLVKKVLVKDFNHFRDRGMYYNEETDPLSAHLFALDGEKWHFLRNKLSPTFTSGKIKYMFLTIRDIGEEFLHCFEKYVEGERPAEVKSLTRYYTADVIGSCAFGLECNSLKNEGSEFIEAGEKVFKPGAFRNMVAFISQSFRGLAKTLGLRQLPSDATAYFMGVIQGTVDYREKNNVMRQDFLQLLMQLKNKGSIEEGADESTQKISMNQLAAQAFLFFIAGFETSSTTLSFALFELAHNPDIQERTREEIQRILASHAGHITYEALKEMTYLDQVVNETLRKYPPIIGLARMANEPYRLDSPDITIEKGTVLFIPTYSIHHEPEIYPNPEQFNPDRFTPEAINARHSHSFLPFGDGPRNCIGMRFGLVEVKFGIVQLLGSLRFAVNERTQVPLVIDKRSSMLEVKDGIWLDVTRV